jgi:hypothetical protein
MRVTFGFWGKEKDIVYHFHSFVAHWSRGIQLAPLRIEDVQ